VDRPAPWAYSGEIPKAEGGPTRTDRAGMPPDWGGGGGHRGEAGGQGPGRVADVRKSSISTSRAPRGWETRGPGAFSRSFPDSGFLLGWRSERAGRVNKRSFDRFHGTGFGWGGGGGGGRCRTKACGAEGWGGAPGAGGADWPFFFFKLRGPGPFSGESRGQDFAMSCCGWRKKMSRHAGLAKARRTWAGGGGALASNRHGWHRMIFGARPPHEGNVDVRGGRGQSTSHGFEPKKGAAPRGRRSPGHSFEPFRGSEKAGGPGGEIPQTLRPAGFLPCWGGKGKLPARAGLN